MGWDADLVKELAARANWSFPVKNGETEAFKESAKAFLETSAALGFGIWFSW
jgi:hypothetical protein